MCSELDSGFYGELAIVTMLHTVDGLLNWIQHIFICHIIGSFTLF